jgi:hypothetical protein
MPRMAHHCYYRLESGPLAIHISRSELKALQKKIGRVLAKRGRGHRTYYVAVAHQGRTFSKLSIITRTAHQRHVAERAETQKPWVLK